MKSIFIVTFEEKENQGHGETGMIKKLATYGGYQEKQYPAFKSREKAQAFIDALQVWYEPQITELPIWDNRKKIKSLRTNGK